MPDSDPLSAVLDEIRKRHEVWGDASDVPRLLAAIESVLKLHTEAVIEDMRPPQFHYCSRCSGHPAWPCPDVQGITRALTGEAGDGD